MRDKKRIKPFCNKLAEIWETKCPDWRFGQFMVNVLGTQQRDPFFPEEDEMIELIENFFKREAHDDDTNKV